MDNKKWDEEGLVSDCFLQSETKTNLVTSRSEWYIVTGSKKVTLSVTELSKPLAKSPYKFGDLSTQVSDKFGSFVKPNYEGTAIKVAVEFDYQLEFLAYLNCAENIGVQISLNGASSPFDCIMHLPGITFSSLWEDYRADSIRAPQKPTELLKKIQSYFPDATWANMAG